MLWDGLTGSGGIGHFLGPTEEQNDLGRSDKGTVTVPPPTSVTTRGTKMT